MSQQQTLQDFYEPHEFTTTDVTKTLVVVLEDPTARKEARLQAALTEATAITQEAAQRILSVPRERWGIATPADSTWYKWAKEIDHGLSNKTAHENIQRVREAFRSWQSSGYDGEKPTFETANRCSFYYRQPRYKDYNDSYYLSLPLAAGRGEREMLPLRDGPYIREQIDRIRADESAVSKNRGELLYQNDRWEFHQSMTAPVEVLETPETTIGVDLGLTNIATAAAVADGEKCGAELWSGAELAQARERFDTRKQAAQADDQYQQIRDDEYRYVNHVCHTISREIIKWAQQYDYPKIVLEDLTDIRETFIRREREHTPAERRALHSWPFRQMQDMIEYKALEAGIPTEMIDPRNTSKKCNECGHTADSNRDSVYFHCTDCGYQVNADVNGAFNIALRSPC